MVNDVELSMEGQTFDADLSDKPLPERRTYHSAGNTAIPRPLATAFISAAVLVDSQIGVMEKPASSVTRSKVSRVPLPYSRKRNF